MGPSARRNLRWRTACTLPITRTRSWWADPAPLEQIQRPGLWRGLGDTERCLRGVGLRQLAHPHTQQPQPPAQVDPLEALAGDAPDGLAGGRENLAGLVARRNPEVVVAQLDADGLAHVALALQVAGQLHAQLGENGAQLRLVAYGVQVAVEGGFAAHRHRLALGHDG